MVRVHHIFLETVQLEEVLVEDILVLNLQLNLVQILVFLESHNMVILVDLGLVLVVMVVVAVVLVELAVLMVMVESVEHHLYLVHR